MCTRSVQLDDISKFLIQLIQFIMLYMSLKIIHAHEYRTTKSLTKSLRTNVEGRSGLVWIDQFLEAVKLISSTMHELPLGVCWCDQDGSLKCVFYPTSRVSLGSETWMFSSIFFHLRKLTQPWCPLVRHLNHCIHWRCQLLFVIM